MDQALLAQTAKTLVAPGKGLLAADESDKSCQKRFDSVGVECTEESRREYRGLLFTTPNASDFMSGVIFYDETFWQKTNDGVAFPDFLGTHGVVPGIKVDKGLIDFPGFSGEKITQGLDGLPERMQKYFQSGARFAKWRAVLEIGEDMPTSECIDANAFVLARYARICQDANIVPIVEPEVLFDGNHTIEQCEEATVKMYTSLFQVMSALRVYIPGAILKTGMILPGKDSGAPIDHDIVAEKTVKVLHENVPNNLGGVVFLSGGQTSNDAFINLNRIAKRGPHPWGVTFSYSRAIQDPVLKYWAKNRTDVKGIQDLFHKQLSLVGAASKGTLDESLLTDNTSASNAQDL